MKNELKINLERLLNYFKINKLRKNMLYQFKVIQTSYLKSFPSMIYTLVSRARKIEQKEETNDLD